MTHSNGVANLKPFKKGKDPRRSPFGTMSQKRATWMKNFLNALADKLDPEDAAEAFAKKYKAGLPFFVGEAHERLGGKVTQPVDADVTVKGQVIFEMARPGKANG